MITYTCIQPGSICNERVHVPTLELGTRDTSKQRLHYLTKSRFHLFSLKEQDLVRKSAYPPPAAGQGHCQRHWLGRGGHELTLRGYICDLRRVSKHHLKKKKLTLKIRPNSSSSSQLTLYTSPPLTRTPRRRTHPVPPSSTPPGTGKVGSSREALKRRRLGELPVALILSFFGWE